jgi:hypothetical protein
MTDSYNDFAQPVSDLDLYWFTVPVAPGRRSTWDREGS